MHGLAHPKPVHAASSINHLQMKAKLVLDAPELSQDFYANTLSWSQQSPHPVALVLGSEVWTCTYVEPNMRSVVPPEHLYQSEHGDRRRIPTTVAWAPPDGPRNSIAIGLRDGSVSVRDASAKLITRNCTTAHRSENARALDWFGNTLACGYGNGVVQLFDIRNKPGTDQRFFKGHQCSSHGIAGLQWRGDGVLLASGGNDNIVNCWDVRMMAKNWRDVSSTAVPLWRWKNGGCVKVSWVLSLSSHRPTRLTVGPGSGLVSLAGEYPGIWCRGRRRTNLLPILSLRARYRLHIHETPDHLTSLLPALQGVRLHDRFPLPPTTLICSRSTLPTAPSLNSVPERQNILGVYHPTPRQACKRCVCFRTRSAQPARRSHVPDPAVLHHHASVSVSGACDDGTQHSLWTNDHGCAQSRRNDVAHGGRGAAHPSDGLGKFFEKGRSL